MGVIFQYPQDAFIPEEHLEGNKSGGVICDADRFGFIIRSQVGTPGYFPLSAVAERTEEEVRANSEDVLKELREEWEKTLQKKESMEAIMELEDINYVIAEVEAEILRYQSRLDNNDKDLPYTLYLQLTIFTNKEIQSIERLQYTGNLGSAMKYLIGRLLNKPMNYVNELIIDPWDLDDFFWLPAEMKLTARYLTIGRYYEEVMRTVGRFFRRINSRPFEIITQPSIHADYIGGNYDEAVTINHIDPSLQIGTIPHIHSRLHFDFCASYERFIGLINYWETNGAPIGTYYTAITNLECFHWYNNMRRREGCTVAKTPTQRCKFICDCLILPLPNNAQLEFYITPVVQRPFTLMLNFKIQPRK